ncbi:MAG: hypothetical protein Q9226_008890 [Calogaya cf. arnoldii]
MVDIKPYYPAEDEYFQYYNPSSAPSVALALAQLKRYIQIEGPFDGVLGFSQGASLAAAYLVRLTRDFPSRPLPFRCAIFFCGGPPFDPQALEQDEMRLVDARKTGPILRLPTAHIWARNDTVWPEGGEMLSELCEEKDSNVYMHDEGHSIPGPRAKVAVQGCVRAIRRTIDRAEMMQ